MFTDDDLQHALVVVEFGVVPEAEVGPEFADVADPLRQPEFEAVNRYSLVRVSNSISEVEEMAGRDDPSLVLPFSPEDEQRLMEGSSTTLKPSRFLAQNHLVGITSTVRSTILQWSLTLEEEGILGEGMTFTAVEKERAAQSQNIHIQNFSGILGNVSGTNVQVGDYGQVYQQLKDANVSRDQRNELEDILDALQSAKPGEKELWAQKGINWLGKNAKNIGSVANVIRLWFTPHLPPGAGDDPHGAATSA